MTLLNRIPIAAGLNEVIFDNLKANVKNLKERDRHCVLMFDEMSLQAHLHFNRSADEIEGFVDMGTNHKTNIIADHGLVFMVKGITRKWKQALGYVFTSGSVNTIDLVRLLKDVIKKCHAAGLNIIATVCDQGASNQAAINYLINDSLMKQSRSGQENDVRFFKVNGRKVIPLYDPPHLIKGIRNNLLQRNLIWKKPETLLTAKWSDVELAYKIDNASGELRVMPKLTENHVNRHKLKKMKVACATQVLSHSVSSVMAVFARSGTYFNKITYY